MVVRLSLALICASAAHLEPGVSFHIVTRGDMQQTFGPSTLRLNMMHIVKESRLFPDLNEGILKSDYYYNCSSMWIITRCAQGSCQQSQAPSL